jgi:hypothetical protein
VSTASDLDATAPPPSPSTRDVEQWREVVAWKDRALTSRTPVLSPLRDGITEIRAAVTDTLRKVPGVARVDDGVQGALHQLAAAGAGAGAATLRRETVFADYRRHGYAVKDFKDIRRLEARDVATVMPRLDLGYTTFAGIQGGVTSFLTSTGATAAAGGAGTTGVGGLPGLAVIAAALTGDAVLTVGACNRAVAHVGAYHGYDGTKRSEQIVALAILAVGLSGENDVPGAYEEVARLVTAKSEGEEQKRKQQQKQLKRLTHAVHQRLLTQIGQRELAQLVPVLGIGIGALLSARLLARVIDAAQNLYRERFLHERYGVPFGHALPFDAATGKPYLDEDEDADEDEIFAGA